MSTFKNDINTQIQKISKSKQITFSMLSSA
jgi:hypothetical protein